jgi:hypothetical protein
MLFLLAFDDLRSRRNTPYDTPRIVIVGLLQVHVDKSFASLHSRLLTYLVRWRRQGCHHSRLPFGEIIRRVGIFFSRLIGYTVVRKAGKNAHRQQVMILCHLISADNSSR